MAASRAKKLALRKTRVPVTRQYRVTHGLPSPKALTSVLTVDQLPQQVSSTAHGIAPAYPSVKSVPSIVPKGTAGLPLTAARPASGNSPKTTGLSVTPYEASDLSYG